MRPQITTPPPSVSFITTKTPWKKWFSQFKNNYLLFVKWISSSLKLLINYLLSANFYIYSFPKTYPENFSVRILNFRLLSLLPKFCEPFFFWEKFSLKYGHIIILLYRKLPTLFKYCQLRATTMLSNIEN